MITSTEPRFCVVRDDSGRYFVCLIEQKEAALQWFADTEIDIVGTRPDSLRVIDLPFLTFTDPKDE